MAQDWLPGFIYLEVVFCVKHPEVERHVYPQPEICGDAHACHPLPQLLQPSPML